MPKRKTADDTADKAAEAFPPSIVEACNGTFLALGQRYLLCLIIVVCLLDVCSVIGRRAAGIMVVLPLLHFPCCRREVFAIAFLELKAYVPVLVSSN